MEIKCTKCGQLINLLVFKKYGKELCFHCALDIPYNIKPAFGSDTPISDLLPDCPSPGEFSLKNKNLLHSLELSVVHFEPTICIEEITVDDMLGWGTSCGNVGNRAFQVNVITEFKKHNINHALAVVCYEEDDYRSIQSLIVPMLATKKQYNSAWRFARTIQKLINKNGGSFEIDIPRGNWVFFESE